MQLEVGCGGLCDLVFLWQLKGRFSHKDTKAQSWKIVFVIKKTVSRK